MFAWSALATAIKIFIMYMLYTMYQFYFRSIISKNTFTFRENQMNNKIIRSFCYDSGDCDLIFAVVWIIIVTFVRCACASSCVNFRLPAVLYE